MSPGATLQRLDHRGQRQDVDLAADGDGHASMIASVSGRLTVTFMP